MTTTVAVAVRPETRPVATSSCGPSGGRASEDAVSVLDLQARVAAGLLDGAPRG